MSRDELLVLCKTLLDLLDKGFIRVSHSPAGAPVLFARKPGGGGGFAILRGLQGPKCRNSKGPIPFTID